MIAAPARIDEREQIEMLSGEEAQDHVRLSIASLPRCALRAGYVNVSYDLRAGVHARVLRAGRVLASCRGRSRPRRRGGGSVRMRWPCGGGRQRRRRRFPWQRACGDGAAQRRGSGSGVRPPIRPSRSGCECPAPLFRRAAPRTQPSPRPGTVAGRAAQRRTRRGRGPSRAAQARA